MISPDTVSTGLLDQPPTPLRYSDDDSAADPHESFGRLRTLMPGGVRVLDVGCGAGSGTMIINKGKGNNVICLEPDAERSAAARSRGLDCRTALFNRETAGLLGQFDVIVFADVLEHLPDPGMTLMLAKTLLRKGGLVLISVPNVAHWTIRTKLLRGNFDYEPGGLMDATHLRWFTFKSLARMLQRTGFAVTHTTGSDGAWISHYQRLPARRRVVSALQSLMPTLFSCQLIVKAEVS